MESAEVTELRLVVTVDDYEDAVRFYRDVLGAPEIARYEANGGHLCLLDLGRATMELAEPAYAAYIDEVEVGRRVGGHIRVALEVGDAAAAAAHSVDAGGILVAPPTRTPWGSLNARLEAPGGLQLTLFSDSSEQPDE